MNRFVEEIQVMLNKFHLSEAELISVSPESPSFGNMEALFRLRQFFLLFTRDRGQISVSLASQEEPMLFHMFEDVEIAMGWQSIEEVLARPKLGPIDNILKCISENRDVLCNAFSGKEEKLTRARVLESTRIRGQAFREYLEGLSEKFIRDKE